MFYIHSDTCSRRRRFRGVCMALTLAAFLAGCDTGEKQQKPKVEAAAAASVYAAAPGR